MGRKLESGAANGPGYAGYWAPFGSRAWAQQLGENILRNARSMYTVDPYAEMMESMGEAMAQQAAMQAEYMNQMALLQEEQLRMQEEAAKAAMIENKKNPSDYSQANADDTARKQLLRRGLMSTFTRYGNANDGGGGKATKLGG